jgi:hypothetical protein
MLRNKIIKIGLAVLIITLSSCGIFHKGCNCPKFGKVKKDVQMRVYSPYLA